MDEKENREWEGLMSVVTSFTLERVKLQSRRRRRQGEFDKQRKP